MNTFSLTKKIAAVGVLITAVFYFIGGKVFDVFSTAIGPLMILAGIAIWILFSSGSFVKESLKAFFFKLCTLIKRSYIICKKQWYNNKAGGKYLIFRKDK